MCCYHYKNRSIFGFVSAVIIVLLFVLSRAQECNAYNADFGRNPQRIPMSQRTGFVTFGHRPTAVQQLSNRISVKNRSFLEIHRLLASPIFSSPNGSSSSSNSSSNSSPVTLTESTLWKVRLSLRDLKTQKGTKVTTPQIYTIYVKFLENEGYEPPQGTLQQVHHSQRPGYTMNTDDVEQLSSVLQISSSYWKLSEDPKERKDGLWVWGLFKEPYYPFLLLQITTEPIPLQEHDTIPPLQLFCQINHRRDKEQGVILQGTSDLNVRQVETVQADPFGAATANIYQDIVVGTISIQPCLFNYNKS